MASLVGWERVVGLQGLPLKGREKIFYNGRDELEDGAVLMMNAFMKSSGSHFKEVDGEEPMSQRQATHTSGSVVCAKGE